MWPPRRLPGLWCEQCGWEEKGGVVKEISPSLTTTWVALLFPADYFCFECSLKTQASAASWLSTLVIGVPAFLYHDSVWFQFLVRRDDLDGVQFSACTACFSFSMGCGNIPPAQTGWSLTAVWIHVLNTCFACLWREMHLIIWTSQE